MKNKGQVVIFVIIGVVLLIIIGLVFMFLTNSNKDYVSYDSFDNPDTVEYFVQSCLESSVNKVTDEFGLIGFKGNLDFNAIDKYVFVNPSDSLEWDINYATYYFLEGQKYFPTIEESQLRYSQLLEREFESCVDNFNIFEEQGIIVDSGILTARASFNKNDISATVDWPMEITDGETIYDRNKFFYKMDYSLKEKYDIVLEYVEFQENDIDYFQIGKIVELSQVHDFKYEIHSLTDDSILVVWIFEDYNEIRGKPLKVVFIVK